MAMERMGRNQQRAVGSTDFTDSTDWKQVGRGYRFTRPVKWTGEAVTLLVPVNR